MNPETVSTEPVQAAETTPELKPPVTITLYEDGGIVVSGKLSFSDALCIIRNAEHRVLNEMEDTPIPLKIEAWDMKYPDSDIPF